MLSTFFFLLYQRLAKPKENRNIVGKLAEDIILRKKKKQNFEGLVLREK